MYLLVCFSILASQPHVMEDTHLARDNFKRPRRTKENPREERNFRGKSFSLYEVVSGLDTIERVIATFAFTWRNCV